MYETPERDLPYNKSPSGVYDFLLGLVCNLYSLIQNKSFTYEKYGIMLEKTIVVSSKSPHPPGKIHTVGSPLE